MARVGGHNFGDPYFQIDPEAQFAGDDVFAAGPLAQRLAWTFDEFRNNGLSIPGSVARAAPPARVHAEVNFLPGFVELHTPYVGDTTEPA